MATTLPSLPPLTGDTSWIDNPTGMEGLPTPIAPARPSTSTSSSATTSSAGSGRAGSLGIDPSGNPYVATSPGGYSNSVTQWISAHVEDFVFIIIGILLIGAAALALGFQGVESAVGTASSGVSRVSKTAGKAAKLAELAA
jgi:hypothetical protein